MALVASSFKARKQVDEIERALAGYEVNLIVAMVVGKPDLTDAVDPECV